MRRTAVAAAILAAIAAAGASAQTADTVVVPDVTGVSRSAAAERLRDAGLRPAAFGGAVRYEPVGDGRRQRFVRARRAGPRAVTQQQPEAGQRVRRGTSVAFATSPPRGPHRFLVELSLATSPYLDRVSVGGGGRRLTLGLDTVSAACGPLDHIDIAVRAEWVLVRPFALAGGRCGDARRHRRAALMLPAPLRGRPVIEQPPQVPNPALVNRRAAPFHAARPASDGRSVVVYFTYGACSGLAGTQVAERDDAVEITLIRGDTGRDVVCPAIAYSGLAVVRLPTPLGGRRIVDGAAG